MSSRQTFKKSPTSKPKQQKTYEEVKAAMLAMHSTLFKSKAIQSPVSTDAEQEDELPEEKVPTKWRSKEAL